MRHSGEVLSENTDGFGIEIDRCEDLESRPFQPQAEPSTAAKKVNAGELLHECIANVVTHLGLQVLGTAQFADDFRVALHARLDSIQDSPALPVHNQLQGRELV